MLDKGRLPVFSRKVLWCVNSTNTTQKMKKKLSRSGLPVFLDMLKPYLKLFKRVDPVPGGRAVT